MNIFKAIWKVYGDGPVGNIFCALISGINTRDCASFASGSFRGIIGHTFWPAFVMVVYNL
jgi:hypothetical protein